MQNLKQRVFRSLYIGLWLTFVFTGISILFWLEDLSWTTVSYCLLISALFCFGLGSGSIIITAYLDHKYDWYKDLNKRLKIGIPIIICYNLLIVFFVDYAIYIRLFKLPLEKFWSFEMIKLHFFYFMIAMGVNSFFYAKAFLKNLRKSVDQQIQLEKEKVLLKYDALKNQIDPHFFFNNLNVLSSLIEEDVDQSQEFIQQLTKIYRYVLSQKKKEIVSVREELNFVEQYIYLQKARFENGVNLKIDIDEEYYESKVVVLSMQLLLENIFKHNSISDESPIFIEIFVRDDYLVIKNNINVKANLQPSTKLGLQNIKERYHLLSDQQFFIENTGNYFIVNLPLL